MEYVKINSLYKREGCGAFDETKGRYVADLEKKPRKSPLIIGEYARPEFESISRWTVDEKIDGTNIRITFTQEFRATHDDAKEAVPYSQKLLFGGRTANAQIPCHLLERLQELFTLEKMAAQFPMCSHVVLFGEGYGPKIQNGGCYSKQPDFVLFDVHCGGWWLQKDAVMEVAMQMGINSNLPLTRPIATIGNPYHWSLDEIVDFVKAKYSSNLSLNLTGEKREMEGIVARAYPLMLFRDGTPVMFKLKCKDFE